MNRLLLLILIAGLTFLIVLFASKPELIEQIWLWVIGLAGPIIKVIQEIVNFFKRMFGGEKDSPDNNKQL
jgi:CBS domain containing-hemolysin-like protein